MHVLHAISVVSTTKFGTKIAHDNLIPHAKENSEIATDVRDNDVIVLKFECCRRKALLWKAGSRQFVNKTLQNLVGLLTDSCGFHFCSQS